MRGEDSTGVAIQPVSKNPKELCDFDVVKSPGPPWILMDMKQYERVLKYQARIIMSHNRSATIGPKTAQYAQPYKFDNVTGMHNGTVQLHEIRDLPNGKDAISDSRTIIESIDLHGIEATLSKIEGAWALVWHDLRDDTLNFIRNDERLLYYCFDEKHECIFWSSEVEHLASAVNRSGIKRKEGEKSFLFSANTWHKWKMPEKNQSFEEPVKTKVEGRPKKTWEFGHRGYYSAGENNKGHSDGNFTKMPTNGITAGSAKTEVPEDAKKRIAELGKDKFPLVYRDDIVRVYFDVNKGEYHRYWWDRSDPQYRHTLCKDKPIEIININVPDLIKRKVVWIGSGFQSGDPSKEPPIDQTHEDLKFKGKLVAVIKKKNTSAKPWVSYVWSANDKEWRRYEDTTPPFILPDSQYDVGASHSFHHSGKRDKKLVRYKGFEGVLLEKHEFNELTRGGCTNCSRSPQWTDGRMGGVKVHFFDSLNFLCEYCGEDQNLFFSLKDISKNQKGNKIANDPLPAIH